MHYNLLMRRGQGSSFLSIAPGFLPTNTDNLTAAKADSVWDGLLVEGELDVRSASDFVDLVPWGSDASRPSQHRRSGMHY